MSSNKQIYDLLKDFIPIQGQAIESSIQSIETKTGIIMASVGIFMPIIVSSVFNGDGHPNVFLIIGMAFAIITLIFNVFCIWGKEFKISPNIKNFYFSYNKGKSYDRAREQLLALSYLDFEYNRSLLQQKGTSFNISLITFVISVSFVVIGILAQPPSKDYTSPIKANTTQIYVNKTK